MDNQQFSSIFREIASLLELQREDPFRIRAYRRAAQTFEHLGESLRSIAQRDALEEIPGIGKVLAREIREILETGRSRYHEHLQATVPEGLLPVLQLPSLSSEHMRILWRQCDITSMKQLLQAFRDERLPFDTPILVALGKDLDAWQRQQNRMLLGVAMPRAEILVQNLARLATVERISLAGSLRRGVATVGDIDIVIASSDPPGLLHTCNQQPEVRQVLETDANTTVVLTSEGLRLSLSAVLPQQYASALLYCTGSVAHVTALQRLAQHRGLRLTEHGLSRLEGGFPVPAAEEADIYHALGFAYIPPELREDNGEIELIEAGRALPTLITLDDVRGDLHVHSDWGNGAHSLEDIAQAGQRLGYQYVAICDYTYSAETGRGLAPEQLERQIAAIRQLNSTLPETFRLLAGAEVEISPDGNLDTDDGVLQELDIVIAAIHTGLKEPRQKITQRLCKAMEHPLVNILAHPTGRMLGRQETPNIDAEALIETAIDTQTCLEINSHVLRLDLPDRYVRQARDVGLTVSLGSDAHTIQEMRTMRLGVLTARRGWIEPGQLLNALPYRGLVQRLKGRDVSHVP
jgi:DNA polymerase (family 10)